MKFILRIALLLLIVDSATAQIKTNFSQLYIDDLYKQSRVIRSASPKDTDYSDLEPVNQSIGNAKIVLLGEPSHGDGGAIQMKTRLVQYLHEKKGFDVVLFEADLYSITFELATLTDTSKISTSAKENIYTCWSESKVSQELWSYYKQSLKSSTPLEIGGIDSRHAGAFAKNALINNLTALLRANNFDVESRTYKLFAKDIHYLLAQEFASKKDSVNIGNFYRVLGEIEESIRYSALNNRMRNLWLIEMVNLKSWFDLIIQDKNRDIGMAKNFFLLAKHIYPGKKIIILSHNNHNVLDVQTYASISDEFRKDWHENETYKSFSYLGSEIWNALKEEVYSLAITSGSGNFSPDFFCKDMFHANFERTATVPKSSEHSLEAYLENKKSMFTFIPLPKAQGKPSGYPWFTARLFDLLFEAKMDYTSAFHGIMYMSKTVNLNQQ